MTISVADKAIEAASVNELPVIDPTIHLWDATRPQGAPWPPRGADVPGLAGDQMRREHLSAQEYRREFCPKGVVGAIVIEASHWIEDNLWLLEASARDDIIVGTIGNLKPEAADFGDWLDRLGTDPLFLGMRYRNSEGPDIVAQSSDPRFLAGLKLLAGRGLVLEAAGMLDNMEAVIRISDAVPELRIVLAHLSYTDPAANDRDRYDAALNEIAQRPGIFGKISSGFDFFADPAQSSRNVADHRARLDRLTAAYGEDRALASIGSIEPNPNLVILRAYFQGRPLAVAEKFFWRNSQAAYRWMPRSPDQPGA